MILPYQIRLVCLSLACFFLIHLILGFVVNLLAPAVLRMSERMRPRFSAAILLAARLLPAAAALVLVAAVCIPSYLLLEPESPVEQVGMICVGAAILSIVILGASAMRGLRAVFRFMLYARRCRRNGSLAHLDGANVWVLKGAGGLLGLAGIVRPRLVISREVLEDLPNEQLAAALRHEYAHYKSRDNLKRLLILLAPEILPLASRPSRGFQTLERAWARFTEWAADDRAVEGDSQGRISLAAALVRVARIGGGAQPSPLMTCLVADGADLEARVERLLATEAVGPRRAQRGAVFVAAGLLISGCFTMIAAGPAMLNITHRILEQLIQLLSS